MPDVTYLRPRDLADAVRLCAEHPDCWPVAGGTDVMVMLHAGAIRPGALLDLWHLGELKGIRRANGTLEIGAAEPYTGMINSALVREHLPALVEASRTIGAAQIQNRGTLGGNLANASPAGDTLPVLLAADAVVVTDWRAIPVAEFFTGYRKTALHAGEISKVVLAVSRAPARIAVGSVAEVPLRATRAEGALAGGNVEGAVAAIAADIRPIDDVRSTAAYRRAVTQNVLRRLLED